MRNDLQSNGFHVTPRYAWPWRPAIGFRTISEKPLDASLFETARADFGCVHGLPSAGSELHSVYHSRNGGFKTVPARRSVQWFTRTNRLDDKSERVKKRILLFLGTNLAILIVLSIAARILGIDRWLMAQGGDLGSLLVFAALFGFGGSFISLAISKWMAKRAMGVHVIEQPSNSAESWLLDTVRKQAAAARIGMPEVGIFDSPAPNAFATGISRNHALVAVSTGLLRSMPENEVEAVLAREVSHVANGDMVTLALIQGVVNTFVIFLARIVGGLVDRAVFRSEDGRGPAYFLTVLVTELVLGVLASMIVFWFSRRREFRADRGGAELTGTRDMIGALERLRAAQGEPLPEQRLAAFGINGHVGAGLKKLFITHPPLEDRIVALRSLGQI